jgi:hypothetical protein
MISVYQETRDGFEYWARADAQILLRGHSLQHGLHVLVRAYDNLPGWFESVCHLSLARCVVSKNGERHDCYEYTGERPAFRTLDEASAHASAFWLRGFAKLKADIRDRARRIEVRT